MCRLPITIGAIPDDDPIDEAGGEQRGDHVGAALDQDRLDAVPLADAASAVANRHPSVVLRHDLDADATVAELGAPVPDRSDRW